MTERFVVVPLGYLPGKVTETGVTSPETYPGCEATSRLGDGGELSGATECRSLVPFSVPEGVEEHMERTKTIALVVGVAIAVTGCGDSDDSGTGGLAGSGGSAGAGGSAGTGGSAGGGGDGGAGGDPGTPALAPLSEVPRFAVVSTNFAESSVAVLDADFAIIDESWINSGTTFPEIVAALGGDVVLPTRQAGDGTLALVDRFQTDVVSRFYVPSGNLNGQVRAQEAGSDYSSNPHDFIFVDQSSGWATRYEPNLNPMADPVDRGTDIVEIDPTTMELTGDRVDLSIFDTTANVMDQEVTVHARPDRGVVVGSTMVIGLDRISAGFEVAGPGLVALVDTDDLSTDSLPLGDGLQSCGDLSPVPGSPSKVMVSCPGYAQPFLDPDQTRASSGILVLDVDEEGATIDKALASLGVPELRTGGSERHRHRRVHGGWVSRSATRTSTATRPMRSS